MKYMNIELWLRRKKIIFGIWKPKFVHYILSLIVEISPKVHQKAAETETCPFQWENSIILTIVQSRRLLLAITPSKVTADK